VCLSASHSVWNASIPPGTYGAYRSVNRLANVLDTGWPAWQNCLMTNFNSPRIIRFATPRCIVCGKDSILQVPENGFRAWQRGELIQIALPELSVDEREMMLNGTHPDCWDAIMGDDEEEN